ncbi:MAG: ATP-binding cassette domain-containing protein [Treponema sp.]|nr:ATP-binding cassette domain-containing protein [Treponema sp.]
MSENLITIKNCRIENEKKTLIPQLDWTFTSGQAWLVIGPNGGGKADFLKALGGKLFIRPNSEGLYSSIFKDSVEIVSLEKAAELIEEERLNDESEFIEGGLDIGRTGRIFIAEALCGKIKKDSPLPKIAEKIEAYPAIKLCGVEKILDRGLKYMSTGEIRRTLLARALISGKKLLILSDPFAGLDIQSRKILLDFFTTIVSNQLKENSGSQYPAIILGMERWQEIPSSITNVLEFSEQKVSFSGSREQYEKLLENRSIENQKKLEEEKQNFANKIEETFQETKIRFNSEDKSLSQKENDQEKNQAENNLKEKSQKDEEILVEMNHVNVGWGDHQVLVDLNWKLKKGQHWLIQGPNGSGKTTFLELITGDCMQVYANDVRLFGIKRGSGESIWDIKKHLGIVSYRLHVEYRMLGGTSLENVIISGFRDSIGLYQTATDSEVASAKKWLELAGFAGREKENFGSLSYGEQRAILILRSAVKCPKILILDEPCHGLDENYRTKILDLMELIAKDGKTTMLHVTHDPSEVLACEHKILELHPTQNPMYQIKER